MTKNILSSLPWIDKMSKEMKGSLFPAYREANGHIHTPYSFSAFDSMETAFSMAKEENIAVLGINDFFVSDGYEDFHNNCIKNNIFPLFNIEFIGLIKEKQKNNIRINDPNNPGRIYFSGKGLDYPFKLPWLDNRRLNKVIASTQEQIRAMIDKLNVLISKDNPSLSLSYDEIKKRFAKDLIRERHLAKAVRVLAVENFKSEEEQTTFLENLYGGKKSKVNIHNPTDLENEIRSNLLKAGGKAFVEEDASSFLELQKIIDIIIKAGGIPCYPVLLDDANGNYTEFEADPEKLYSSLSALNIGCIELIPGRNNIDHLRRFVDFFDRKGFVVLFGTEHNSPAMTPLTVTARGNTPLDETLKQTVWDGVCVVAAHQYLRAHKRQGYILENGTPSFDQKKELAKLGQLVIEYYLYKNSIQQ